MAILYLKTNILLAIVFIILGASSSFEDYEIEDICSETLNPKSCFKILKSTPLTEQSDVVGLEKFLINHAHTNVINTINQIQSIIKKITDPHFGKLTDPRSKEIYMTSSTHFKWAATFCGNALTAWTGRHKGDMIVALTSVARIVEECQSDLQSHVKPDPGSQLIARIGLIYDLCDVALVLTDKLP